MTGRKHRATDGIGTAPGKATGWAVVPVTEEGRKLRPWGVSEVEWVQSGSDSMGRTTSMELCLSLSGLQQTSPHLEEGKNAFFIPQNKTPNPNRFYLALIWALIAKDV